MKWRTRKLNDRDLLFVINLITAISIPLHFTLYDAAAF